MTIKFHCEHCGKLIQAPDEAGGRRGTCPHCNGSNFIPAAEKEPELEVAPLDEQAERERQEEIERLLDAERDLRAASAPVEKTPRLSQRPTTEVDPAELHHLVVNYCLDMANGRLDRAETHVARLNQHRGPNRVAVSDFLSGKILEPTLDPIPAKVLQGFLENLQKQME